MGITNTGTLLSAAARPANSDDPIAIAFQNEVKGGHHSYATLLERDGIIEPRRQWGMLVTIYNDGINNKTYILKYGYIDTNINNNTNWVVFATGSGSGGSSEWVDSVFSILNNPPSSPLNGDRYLIDTLPTGVWTANPNKIAQWDSVLSSWVYTIPTNNMSVRVDNIDNAIYKYDTPSLTWIRDLVNQVRFINPTSINGLSYSVSGLTPSIDMYSKDVVFLTNFGTSSFGGTTSLNISGLGDVVIKKSVSGSLVNIESKDFYSGTIYKLVYDGTYFQSDIPSANMSGVIGVAPDGDYTDGLFTDFNPNTPIGTPIDRFNEILKSLVPPPAPVISDWSANSTTTSGKLVFDNINGILGYNYVAATGSPYGSVDIDQLWTPSVHRLGIRSYVGAYSNDIMGVLNYQVPVHTGIPTPSYIAKSFTDGATGSLYMLVNGMTISSIDLSSTYSPIDSTLSGATSGISVTAATSSKFPGGDPFNIFINRTGTWLITNNDIKPNSTGPKYPNAINIVEGYNNVIIKHVKSASTITLPRWEFILDDNTSATTNVTSIPSFAFGSTRYLSGIKYFQSGSVTYQWSISNLYRNTYYPNGDALTFTDLNSPGSGGSIVPILNTNSYQLGLSNSNGDETTVVSGMNSFVIASSGVRRLNESIALKMQAKRTVQALYDGGAQSVPALVIDNVPTSSTLIGYEDFNDETFRLKNTTGAFQYDFYSSILSNIWDKTQSLTTGTPNHTNGLQTYSGKLVYPSIDFSSIGTIFTNDNFGSAQTNYTSASGNRIYVRYFQKTSTTNSNFIIQLNGSGITLVPTGGSLSANQSTLEFKMPGLSSPVTGWLDAYKDFPPSPTYLDGDGCRNQGAGAGRSLNTPWGINVGVKTTANSSGYVLIRFTVGAGSTGNLTDINFSFT
jgi:hypothetical protein